MLPSMLPPVHRSLSSTTLSQLGTPPPGARNRHASTPTPVVMGPVTASIVLYVGSRLVNRICNGQLMRKGVPRKMRRMCTLLVVDWHLLYEMLLDCLEDIP